MDPQQQSPLAALLMALMQRLQPQQPLREATPMDITMSHNDARDTNYAYMNGGGTQMLGPLLTQGYRRAEDQR